MIKLLVLIVVVLAIITIAQIVRIAELVSDLNADRKEETKGGDNKTNAILMMVFLIAELVFMFYQLKAYKPHLLPESASQHGVGVDNLLNINFLVIGFVFLITQILLFWYAYKFRYNKNRKATFYPDNHKLETIWTVIPTIVLVILIVYGLKTWNEITTPAPAEAINIELYSKQFDWTARYSGGDNLLGRADYKLIADDNVLGLDTLDNTCSDDIITKELHLPVNKHISFTFHSRDVIHSAYLPHFRVQMNTVPGMSTKFHFVPTITTAEMRKITKNDKFDYVLLCNKICGVAHFNMKMKVIVESEQDYNAWLKTQAPFRQLAQAEVTQNPPTDVEAAAEGKDATAQPVKK
jgi:cytochrome c oxidase subunit II